jgi:hypothetical protein
MLPTSSHRPQLTIAHDEVFGERSFSFFGKPVSGERFLRRRRNPCRVSWVVRAWCTASGELPHSCEGNDIAAER